MKKIFLFALVLVVGFLFGCGTVDSTATADVNPAPETIAEPLPPLTSNPCRAKFLNVEFKPSWQDLTPEEMEREVAPTAPYTADGSKVPVGRYLAYTGGKSTYLLKYEDKDCQTAAVNLQFEFAPEQTLHSVIGLGLVVDVDGVHSAGTGDLEFFVESPKGSGKYKFEIPKPPKESKHPKPQEPHLAPKSSPAPTIEVRPIRGTLNA